VTPFAIHIILLLVANIFLSIGLSSAYIVTTGPFPFVLVVHAVGLMMTSPFVSIKASYIPTILVAGIACLRWFPTKLVTLFRFFGRIIAALNFSR